MSDAPRPSDVPVPDGLDALHAAHARRVAALDPLAGVPTLLRGEDARAVRSPDGRAVALVDVVATDARGTGALWSEDRVGRVQLRLAGDEQPAEELADLLRRACDLLPPDLAVQVTVASRDLVLTRPLLVAGFAATTTTAVRRVTTTDARQQPAVPDGLRVRPATGDDVEAMVAATLAVQAFDTRAGILPRRTGLEPVVRREVEEAVAERSGWSWVAERDGAVVGVVRASPPEHSDWIATSVAQGPTAYLGLLHVEPTARGGGAGAALAAAVHLRAAAAGVRTVALHHSATNPLSAPFWARTGYRPVLTGWQRQPRT